MTDFSIREDLESRPLDQQIEILWISGPTWHDAPKIARALGITEERVRESIESSESPRIASSSRLPAWATVMDHEDLYRGRR